MTSPYLPKHPVRIISAAALFDGHDASINVMRRLLQASGCEVIHLGHNRSVEEVANAAVQEDAQGIALTSYQGGHVEYFTYLRERLDALGAKHTRIFGGGGGVIVPREIELLHGRGIDRVFSPEDGRTLGLQGMIDLVVQGCDFATETPIEGAGWMSLARRLSRIENGLDPAPAAKKVPIVGLTGTGGAGKSSLTDELVRRFLWDFPDKKVAVLCIDPTKKRTGGALLGDRIRMNALKSPRAYMRSMATRGSGSEISGSAKNAIACLSNAGFDLVLVETAGIGQGDSEVLELADTTVYVMTAEYGAPTQLEKIEMLDHADFIAINKFTRRGSEDALRDVRRQVQRSRKLTGKLDELMVFGTSAAHFNDSGVNALYAHLALEVSRKHGLAWVSHVDASSARTTDTKQHIVPPGRERYLSEIADACRAYDAEARAVSEQVAEIDALERTVAILGGPFFGVSAYGEQNIASAPERARDLMREHDARLARLDPKLVQTLARWPQMQLEYTGDKNSYEVRGKAVVVENYRDTLSELRVPKVALPRFSAWSDRLYWQMKENVPGRFPYTAGTFPYKRTAEDPTRMFAGEGPSERTNKRFHLLAAGQPAARLSTAFDSITLYGEDPDERPDIYGKIGESGVSIATVEEAEQLYAGFDLCNPATSVSMTINGPAPTVLAFFVVAAVRQQCRRFLRVEKRLAISEAEELQPDALRGSSWQDVRALLTDAEHAKIRSKTLQQIRGTVQADILKEDQGQNTCIFSTEFALRMMGDVQQFFIDNDVRNFYSVSISGYHIAEAGANPIHQLAFTLANGFTYVEYYRSRGMDVNAFAPNLSFFFSNGMDPEYTVIGRVARRIWAVAMQRLFGADARSQMLKYHIQTSGRSLHAQEIQFNDIRTTLQALLATYDNAQSLHTNAYDEAITTPTEESVRRALAIQQIINREFGMVFCENATQGSFLVEELTDLVEAAVLQEFDRLTDRGGVLGAMERQYQRGQIQDDSMKYERMKHSGELPIVGVNTFLAKTSSEASAPREVELSRASTTEKNACITRLRAFQAAHQAHAPVALKRLTDACLSDRNGFSALLEAVEHCSLGQITHALYEVGGEYRRNL
jgi:methylmalonyl-CoA mutase